MILYVVALIPHSLAGTSQALLTVLGRFHVIAVIETATTVVRVTLVLALVFVGWGVSGVVWGHAIAMTFTGLLYGGIAFALIQRTWDLSVLQGSWQALQGRRREIVRFLVYSDCNALLGMLMKQMDVVLLGYLCNPTEAGYYKLAKSFASTISHLTHPLQSVIYPKLSYLWGAGRVDDFHQMIYKLALGLGLPCAIMVLLGLLSVPLLILSFLGESYLPMSLATQLLLTVTGLRLIGFWIKPFYLSTGQMRLWTMFSLIGAVLSIPAYAGSIWFWGFQGLATARLGLGIVTDVIPGIKAIFWSFKKKQGTTSTKV
jgi:O-antigen/teichoic acid export membrane protein